MPIDYKRYPPNWKQIRQRILERAGHKCEFCSVPNKAIICRGEWKGVPVWQDMDGNIFQMDGQSIDSNYVGDLYGKVTDCKIVLTIAHLDHDPENWDVQDDRLKALCQKCHLDYDKEHHKANRKQSRKNKMGLISLFEQENNGLDTH